MKGENRIILYLSDGNDNNYLTSLHEAFYKETGDGFIKIQIVDRSLWMIPYSSNENSLSKYIKDLQSYDPIDGLLIFPQLVEISSNLLTMFPNIPLFQIQIENRDIDKNNRIFGRAFTARLKKLYSINKNDDHHILTPSSIRGRDRWMLGTLFLNDQYNDALRLFREKIAHYYNGYLQKYDYSTGQYFQVVEL